MTLRVFLVEDATAGTPSARPALNQRGDIDLSFLPFSSEAEFAQCIDYVIGSGCDAESALLVISAHGVAGTGTRIGPNIDLAFHRQRLTSLPEGWVVFLSACWAGYPSLLDFRGDRARQPFLVGPMVDVFATHADDVMNRLIEVLVEGRASSDALGAVVDELEGKLVPHYDGRPVLRRMTRSGAVLPRWGEGGFSGPRTEVTRLRIIAAKQDFSRSPNDHPRIVVKDAEARRWLLTAASSAQILEVVGRDLNEVVGREFSARFTVKLRPAKDIELSLGEAIEFEGLQRHDDAVTIPHDWLVPHHNERAAHRTGRELVIVRSDLAEENCVDCCYGNIRRRVEIIHPEPPRLRTDVVCVRDTCSVRCPP